jgi:hypothetical protein
MLREPLVAHVAEHFTMRREIADHSSSKSSAYPWLSTTSPFCVIGT